MYSNSHFYKPPYYPYPYTHFQYPTMYNPFYLQYHNQIHQFKPTVFHQVPQPVQQQNYITISDDEDSIPKKEIPQQSSSQPVQSLQTQKQIVRMLDLDYLESQGKLYDGESSSLPSLPKRIIQKPQKLIYKQQKKRKHKCKRQPAKKPFRYIKQVQISKTRQQLDIPQSSVKVRLIKVYEKNEDQFLKLFEILKLYFPQANDEDVATILNICDKNYTKAELLIQESKCFIQQIIQRSTIS
ncbi:unnamed protein product [Paramecium primaurelia]|uniref:Uncharacterized protein n=1 Tax=Paramecium primaurelia TaxID=5886 RepID=A0A8S1NBB8_PARPR|nr:unnamed protein product [Paramecium primaurelia]